MPLSQCDARSAIAAIYLSRRCLSQSLRLRPCPTMVQIWSKLVDYSIPFMAIDKLNCVGLCCRAS